MAAEIIAFPGRRAVQDAPMRRRGVTTANEFLRQVRAHAPEVADVSDHQVRLLYAMARAAAQADEWRA